MELLYRATQHGWAAADFHRHCEGRRGGLLVGQKRGESERERELRHVPKCVVTTAKLGGAERGLLGETFPRLPIPTALPGRLQPLPAPRECDMPPSVGDTLVPQEGRTFTLL